ncbi:protein translocase subunit SecF [Nakamurella sp. YIM 132087]|uniref:Protein-export membrane protein SecF n=1 Tax=Nakamurella alba TaxID=2665158 RepID=A0A7K1FT58_9ACTN|nr:protein translocase subunit SecF [Nakamurella alba]MTD16363.1 protein translocase subunit SecF [Nakamurella alba]
MTTVDELTSDEAAVPAPKRSGTFLGRLSTGTGAFDILGPRRWYYIASLVLVVLSVLFIVIRGFNFGIDFAGGTRFTFQIPDGQSYSQVQERTVDVFAGAAGVPSEAIQQIGTNQVQISSVSLDAQQVAAVKTALESAFSPVGGVSDSAVSNTWGSEISERAILAVVVFLVLVAIFIWIRYERRVAVGAVISTVHDLVVTAGIYAAVGFEVTPATVIGLLTILGFSLYDTVVVYDKVQENSKGLLSLTRRTYQEAANLAVNQTLMRSINTSLIALLPVAGLLVAGVAILGSGTLKDLALVLLVGMLVGAYSSVFVAVPLAVDLKNRDPQIKQHTARVLAKRKQEGLTVDADGDPIARRGAPVAVAPSGTAAPRVITPPKPGVKPTRPAARKPAATTESGTAPARPAASAPKRPTGKGARPTGKRGR